MRAPAGAASDFVRLQEIEKPVLVVVGEQDVDPCRRIAEELGKRVPTAKAAVIKGAGHLPPWDRPDEFNRVLFEFLDTQGPSGRDAARR